MAHAAPSDSSKAPPVLAVAAGQAFGRPCEFKVASPRACALADGKVSLRLKSGQPALISHRTGHGRAYLLGFCLQESYFQTYRDADLPARTQLSRLISDLFHDAQVRPHIRSSNPDIEAAVRADSTQGYVFLINHEATDPHVNVQLADLGFRVRHIVDIESAEPARLRSTPHGIEFDATLPFGSTRLFRLTP
jgi:hypothetical protein